MELLSRDLRSVVARFVPLPCIAKLMRCSKLLRSQWAELFERRLAACAKKSLDATCDVAGMVLLFLDDTGGVFHFRLGMNAGWRTIADWGGGTKTSRRSFEEIRGEFSVNRAGDEFFLRCREHSKGLRRVTEWNTCDAEAVASLSGSTIEVTDMPVLGTKSMVLVSHGPFSFSYNAFFRKQLDQFVRRGAMEPQDEDADPKDAGA